MFTLGVKPFIPSRDKDDEETQLLALGQIVAQQDKFESDKFTTGAVTNREDQDDLLDNLDEDWMFNSRTTPTTPTSTGLNSPGFIETDYSPDKCETEPEKALGDEEDKYTKAGNNCFDELGDKPRSLKR